MKILQKIVRAVIDDLIPLTIIVTIVALVVVLIGLVQVHKSLVHLQDRVQAVETDLNLGSPRTTQTFRMQLLTDIQKLTALTSSLAANVSLNENLLRHLLQLQDGKTHEWSSQFEPQPTPTVGSAP